MRFGFKTSPQSTTWDDMLAVWRAADEIDLFKCAGSTADTVAVAAASWASYVMDATRYVQIEADAGQSQQQGGRQRGLVERREDDRAVRLQAS